MATNIHVFVHLHMQCKMPFVFVFQREHLSVTLFLYRQNGNNERIKKRMGMKLKCMHELPPLELMTLLSPFVLVSLVITQPLKY